MGTSSPPRRLILVVEDDEDVRESIAGSLDDGGYRVACASNGQEALAWLHRNPPPCMILLDLWMPVMSGEDFRKAQLADPALASIPVVLISAARDVHERASRLGVRDYITKPLGLDALMSVVAHHC